MVSRIKRTGFFLVILHQCSCGNLGPGFLRHEKAANFPIYFTVAGSSMGEGGIYKITEVSEGERSTPKLIVGSLNFPTGIALDTTGKIYFTETLPSPRGRLMYIEPGGSEAEVLLDGLHNPTGVSVDSFNHVYLTERDQNRIHIYDAEGKATIIERSDLASPRDIYVAPDDSIYITQLDEDGVAKIDRDGRPTPFVNDIATPFGLTGRSTGELYVIDNHTGVNDGEIKKVDQSGTATAVVGDLTNPTSITYNNAHGLFIVEGQPANRIVLYDEKSEDVTVISATGTNPYAVTMSPL